MERTEAIGNGGLAGAETSEAGTELSLKVFCARVEESMR